MSKKRKTPIDLVFAPRFSGLEVGYFASLDRFEFVKAIYRAIGGARTWGDLRKLMPAGEFESLSMWALNGGESVYVDGDILFFDDPSYPFDDGLTPEQRQQLVISATDQLDSQKLPGLGDGDYPPFLEPEQDRFLPGEFCEKYGARMDSMVSGSWWEFPVDQFDEMRVELAKLGFSVTLRDAIE